MIEARIRLPRNHQQHVNQVLLGFMRLAQKNILRLSIEPADISANDKISQIGAILFASINGRVDLVYDLNDGYNFYRKGVHIYREFMDRLCSQADLYFKRSFDRKRNSELREPEKVRPLGLNMGYDVPLTVIERSKLVLKELLQGNKPVTPESIESLPSRDRSPTIIFQTRLWDPGEPDIHTDEKGVDAIRNDRLNLNEFRIACVQACRKKFGPRFRGGIEPTSYARNACPKELLLSVDATRSGNYFSAMKQCSIGLTTTGLHASTGWKFGEYVAAAKAIVSEKLAYELPGSFTEGKNYAAFTSIDSCIDAVDRLLSDDELRFHMMEMNYNYYRNYLTPSQLVSRSLCIAMEESSDGIPEELRRVASA